MPVISGNVGAVASVSSVFGRNGAVVAANGDYSGVVATHLTGATAATRYVGGTASGAPVAGTFAVGDFVIDQTGKVYICTVAGTPGTWVAPGAASPVTAMLGLAAIDVHAITFHPMKWDSLHNNPVAFTPLAAIPAGLGLSFAFDGSSADITATEDGTWAFSLSSGAPFDATWAGDYQLDPNNFGPAVSAFPSPAGIGTSVMPSMTVKYPSGAVITPTINTNVGATANPFTITGSFLVVVRLA